MFSEFFEMMEDKATSREETLKRLETIHKKDRAHSAFQLGIVDALLEVYDDPDYQIGLKILKQSIKLNTYLNDLHNYAIPDYEGDKYKRQKALEAVISANEILEKALRK